MMVAAAPFYGPPACNAGVRQDLTTFQGTDLSSTVLLLRLSSATRRRLMRTCVLVALVRLGLWTLPFATVQRLTRRLSRRSRRAVHPLTAEAADARARLVEVAAGWVPGASCLTQALALQVLLGRAGMESQLRIGVTRGEESRFEAHAWLECDGRVVIGGGGLDRYAAFPPLSERAG